MATTKTTTKPPPIDPMDDRALDERDDRVRSLVTQYIADARREAREAREEATRLEHAASVLADDVRNGRFWRLGGLLEQRDLESLSEVEPGTPEGRAESFLQ